MRKHLFVLIALSILAGTSCQEKIDIIKEEEAIKALIREEIAHDHDRDYIRGSETWKQENYVRMIKHSGNWHDQIVGWENILAELKKKSEVPFPVNLDISGEARDFNIKIFGQVAWAVYYQDWGIEMNHPPAVSTQSRVCILEKVDDNWKIALMTMTSLDPCQINIVDEIVVKPKVKE
jgi:hypothetical protein